MSSPSPLAHAGFRRLLVARFASVTASQMLSVAVGWQVYALTGRPLDLGFVGLAQFLPAAGLSVLGGHVADRFDRRRVVQACHASVALISLALLFEVETGRASLPLVYATLALYGATRAFMGPSGQALVPSVVGEGQLGPAVAWTSTVFELATICGPMLGGALYAWTNGARAVFAVCASLSLVAFVLVGGIHVAPTRRATGGVTAASLLAGVRYVLHRRIILGSISLDLFAVLLGGAVALLPAIARDVLGVGPTGLGMLRAAPAVGAGLMAAWLSVRPLGRHAGAKMLAGVAVFGVATIVFGLSRSLPLSLLALAVLGAADMVSVVVRLTLVQLATPPEMRGRVSAVNMVFVGASNELGEFESGFTAALLGVVPAVALGGVGTLLVVALFWFWFPELRRVDQLTPEALETS